MIDWNSSGRLFHSFWPLKVNARWPAAVLQSGICRRSLFLVLQLCTSDLVLNFWQRYGGASPFKHLNTMVASLTASCLIIGSHCNCLRIGVTWSNFLVPETIRAAKFCTVCNSSMFFLVVLASRAFWSWGTRPLKWCKLQWFVIARKFLLEHD